MSLAQLTDPQAVLRAIAEYDELGRMAFLAKYGFGEAKSFWLVHEGRRYDSKAIAGVAHGYQHPDLGPLTNDLFSGGAADTVACLERLGFTVDSDETPAKIRRRFLQIKTTTLVGGQTSPHKPLLALLALRDLREGRPRLQSAAVVAGELGQLLGRALPDVKAPRPLEPIWRLESHLWQLDSVSGDPRGVLSTDDPPALSVFEEHSILCGLTQEVFGALRAAPDWRIRIEEDLIEKFLQGIPADVIDDARGLAKRHWLFQANPDTWDLAARLETWAPGETEDWSLSRYQSEVRDGDHVALFSAGKAGGVLAIGRIKGSPVVRPRAAYKPDNGSDTEPAVLVELVRRLAPSVARTTLVEHPVLKDLSVLHFANATNFKVTAEQWKALMDITSQDLAGTKLERAVKRFQAKVPVLEADRLKAEKQRQTISAMLTKSALESLRDGGTSGLFGWINSIAFGHLGGAGMKLTKSVQDAVPPVLIEGLIDLLYGDGSTAERVERVVFGDVPVPGMSEAVATKLLAVEHPDEWIPYFTSAGDFGRERWLAELEIPYEPATEPSDRMVRSNEVLRLALSPHFDNTWDMRQFVWFLRTEKSEHLAEPNSLDPLAKHLHLPVTFLEETLELLDDKKQVVFYGPPGTGKTYVAMELASYLTEPDAVELVQFHPSYSYEDFVEGYRPTRDGFQLQSGPLKRLAKAALEDPQRTYVLIVDELNRGNVAKVFGELYFLLEYRDRPIKLQYSNEDFRLPDNLLIMATMNSADRSIGLLDAALRRRFHFVSFYPTDEHLAQMLPNWLKDNCPNLAWIALVLKKANELLGDRHLAIGPSHFMKPGMTEERVRKVWKHSILPYLEDQFFDQEAQLDQFQLDKLRKSLSAPPVEQNP